MVFTALQDFWSEELQSQYCQHLTYTVRPGDTTLARLVPTWVSEGKITIGVVAPAIVTGVSGEGG